MSAKEDIMSNYGNYSLIYLMSYQLQLALMIKFYWFMEVYPLI